MDLVDAWPLFGLRLRHDDLEMRVLTDADALVVASWLPSLLTPEERHFMPMLSASLPTGGPIDVARFELTWLWGRRAATSPDSWAMPLIVELDGEPVAVQSCMAERFPVRRTIGSGSFMPVEHRGRGVGTRARAAMLELVFGSFGALAAESGHMAGNEASRRVSERLGYEPNGVAFHEYDGRRYEEHKLLLDRDRWFADRPDWLDDLEVIGVEPVLRQLGLPDREGAGPT